MEPEDKFCRTCQESYNIGGCSCGIEHQEDELSSSMQLIELLSKFNGLSWSYLNPHYVQVYDSDGQLSVSSYRALMGLHGLDAPSHDEVWAVLEEASVGYLHASGELSSIDLEKFYSDENPF